MLVRMMRSLTRILTLLPTWFALCSFVFPAGSAICIGPGGHVAVESATPAGVPCCDGPAATATPSCTTESDEPCADISLDTGAALVGRTDVEIGGSVTAIACDDFSGIGPHSVKVPGSAPYSLASPSSWT